MNHFKSNLQGPLSLSDPAHSHWASCSGVSSFYLCLVAHVMPNANHDKEIIWDAGIMSLMVKSPMDSVYRGESSELAAPGNMRARWSKEKINKDNN